jgi:hypothetical protein
MRTLLRYACLASLCTASVACDLDQTSAPPTPPTIGRFQRFDEGLRTWRLDTATGALCLLLAPDADWATPGTRAQACKE